MEHSLNVMEYIYNLCDNPELLSDLELEVLELYLNGKSYQYIADKLSRDVKSIDNALQRVKRKLEKYLENRND